MGLKGTQGFPSGYPLSCQMDTPQDLWASPLHPEYQEAGTSHFFLIPSIKDT